MVKIDTAKMPDTCPMCGGTGKHVMDMAARITWLRKEARMTQEEFSNRIGMHRASLANVETGRHALTPDMIVKVCCEFQVSSDWLLGIDQTPTPTS